MDLHRAAACCLLVACALSGCSSGSLESQSSPSIAGVSPQIAASRTIRHVVVIVQENRTVDNLFQSFAGANTVSTCTDAAGVSHHLIAQPLNGSTAPGHTHFAFLSDLYSTWDHVAGHAVGPATNRGWLASHCGFVPQNGVKPYYAMAHEYTFANNFFQTNQGPSYPAHLYLVAGSSACTGASANGLNGPVYGPCELPTPWPIADNPGPKHFQGGCDSVTGTVAPLVNPSDTTQTAPQGVFPCLRSRSLIDEAQAAGLSWAFYQSGPEAGYWRALDSIESVWCSPNAVPCSTAGSAYAANVRYPSVNGSDVAAKFIADLGTCGKLANLTYITPNQAESDHAGTTDGSGPSYVARVVNALGNSCYWKNTAIFVTWDDWGGWFDHVCPGGGTSNPCPAMRSAYELGYRVPLIVISPYARNRYVTSNQYDFGSLLLYIERNFRLPSLGAADAKANDLTADVFDYTKRPKRFSPFAAPYGAQWFAKRQRHDPPGTLVPDDDTDGH